MAQKKIRCIVCDKEFEESKANLYKPLKYFEDACLCHECLRKEKEGWPPTNLKESKVDKLADIKP